MGEVRWVEVEFRGEPLPVAYIRGGTGASTIVYLHGLGSSRNDFLGAMAPGGLPGFDLVAFDFPGCGATPYPGGAPVSVEELAGLTAGFLKKLGLRKCTVIGHSLGGLTALLLAHRRSDLVESMIDVEGNLAPEDCFWSRRAAQYRPGRPGEFFDQFEREQRMSSLSGFAAYAETFRACVTEPVFLSYCRSIVRLSDEAPLLEWFTGLGIPRLFIYGAENATLSYLPRLRSEGISVAEIPESSHFPAATNPADYYAAIREFLGRR